MNSVHQGRDRLNPMADRRAETLTGRERVRLALAHEETDRFPIAMVCSGINPPARRALASWLRRKRGLSVDKYVDSFLDIRQVTLDYIGPPLRPGEDEWGVVRAAVSYGSGNYDEIHEYPWVPCKQSANWMTTGGRARRCSTTHPFPTSWLRRRRTASAA